jgi:hypothetical protein
VALVVAQPQDSQEHRSTEPTRPPVSQESQPSIVATAQLALGLLVLQFNGNGGRSTMIREPRSPSLCKHELGLGSCQFVGGSRDDKEAQDPLQPLDLGAASAEHELGLLGSVS